MCYEKVCEDVGKVVREQVGYRDRYPKSSSHRYTQVFQFKPILGTRRCPALTRLVASCVGPAHSATGKVGVERYKVSTKKSPVF